MVGRAPVGRKVIGRAFNTAAAVNGPAYLTASGSASVLWDTSALAPASIISAGVTRGMFVGSATGASGWEPHYVTEAVFMAPGVLTVC
jgi:hypothetical protein